MTRYVAGDEDRTTELVLLFDETGAVPSASWLRHNFLGGELDRRLLAGATTGELAEVRLTWRQHIRHLIEEHRISVLEQAPGYWRIVGLGNDGNPTPNERKFAEADEVDPVDRFAVTAEAIAALAQRGLHAHPKLKASVGMLIRQASESSHWHVCAHYRSNAAAADIDAQDIGSRAQYQQYCRANLRHEHIVPNNVIYKILAEQVGSRTTAAEIEALLRTFCLRATITLREDAMLNDAGLKLKMPAGFDVPGHRYHRDPLSRYRHVGLYENLQARGDAPWFVGPDEPLQ